MFNRVSERITENMVKHSTVSPEDKELYLFGVQQGLSILLNIATTVAVGLAFGVFWQLLLFMGGYIPLRSFAGGYHAKTPLRCYVLSILILVAVALMTKYVVLHIFVQVGLLLSASVIIIALSPVGNDNKPLDELEKKVYKRKAVGICTFEFAIGIFLLYIGLRAVSVCVTWSLTVVCFMLLTEKVSKRIAVKC